MNLKGTVENIIFRNDDNGWTVLHVRVGKTVFTFVGNIVNINIGETIDAEVEEVAHPQYGTQYKIIKYDILIPNSDKDAIYKFLYSLKIKGVGETTINRIIDEFGLSTIDTIMNDSEKLSTIKGMTYEKIEKLKEKVLEREKEIDIIIALGKYNLSAKTISKIIDEYGSATLDVINENPYDMALKIDGVGFGTCDDIAKINGIKFDSDKRIEAGLLYILENEYMDGNVYVEKNALINKAYEILSLSDDKNFDDILYNLEINMRIKTDRYDNIELVFLRNAYNTEKKLSVLLYEKKEDITIITGGPGTGKTYTIKKYLNEAVHSGIKFAICAPTGRAAKRIKEVTGFDAKTIHRLLECVGDKNAGGKVYFNINEENKLDIDLLIVDEMSMVDEYLMYALIRSVPKGTSIVLVGDVDQLPSVGAGQVLKDMIESKYFEVNKLTEIHRQEEGSNIIINAHMVNKGERIDLSSKTEDFMFIHKSTEMAVK